MFEITEHARERYAQRVCEKESNWDVNNYIVNNKTVIYERINELIQYGELIYKGKITNKHQEAEYYIKDSIAVIVDPINSKVVTLYEIKYKFPEHMNKAIIDSLVDEIHKINDELNSHREEFGEAVESIDATLDQNTIDIENLKKEIQYIEQANETLKSTKIQMMKKGNILEGKKKDYVYQLFGNTDFTKKG